MDKNFEDELREEFKKILYDLANFDGRDNDDIDDEKMCLEIYSKFDKLYGSIDSKGEGFRHYYSDIFIVLSNINNEVYGGDILNITSKIQRLFEYIDKHKQEHEFKDIVISKVKKLYDHLTLEKSRIDYTYSMFRIENNFSISSFRDEINAAEGKLNSGEKKIEEVKKNIDTLVIKTQNYQDEINTAQERLSLSEKKIEEVKKNIDILGRKTQNYQDEINTAQERLSLSEKKIEEVKKNIDILGRKTQNYQKEYIAILSIFSSVVLAFIGGITFSASVLQNVHNLNIWIGLSVISLLGLVLSNILFMLFNFISNIINEKNKFVKGIYYILFNIVMLTILVVSLTKYFKR